MNSKSISQNPTTATTKNEVNGPTWLPEEYITKDEVARRLKKTPRTIENWQRKGHIPFVKVGMSVLYRWSDVQQVLERNCRVCLVKG